MAWGGVGKEGTWAVTDAACGSSWKAPENRLLGLVRWGAWGGALCVQRRGGRADSGVQSGRVEGWGLNGR